MHTTSLGSLGLRHTTWYQTVTLRTLWLGPRRRLIGHTLSALTTVAPHCAPSRAHSAATSAESARRLRHGGMLPYRAGGKHCESAPGPGSRRTPRRCESTPANTSAGGTTRTLSTALRSRQEPGRPSAGSRRLSEVNDFEMVQMGLPGWRAALDRIEAEGEKRLADVRKMDDLRMAEIRELKAEVERLRA